MYHIYHNMYTKLLYKDHKIYISVRLCPLGIENGPGWVRGLLETLRRREERGRQSAEALASSERSRADLAVAAGRVTFALLGWGCRFTFWDR